MGYEWSWSGVELDLERGWELAYRNGGNKIIFETNYIFSRNRFDK